MSIFSRLGRAFGSPSSAKAANITFASTSGRWWSMFLGRSRYDFKREVRPDSSSILMACVEWIGRTFPEAPIRVCKINVDGEDEPIYDHPLKLLLDTPNPYYPGELLWSATLADRTLTGNAYWLKVRSGVGRVVELYWVPSWTMEPVGNDQQFISHYEYRPDSAKEAVIYQPAEVVHFRYGRFDHQNIRKSASPLEPLYRELFTDDEAANYTASMLRNAGVPPVILSPASMDMSPSQDELEQTKQRYQELTTGDNRGQVMVMTGATKVDKIGFNPTEMDVKMLRRVPEERVSALLGIHAIVVGLGAGLERSTFSNFAEAREAAYESNIIPTQRLVAAELRTQLLPDFGNVSRLKVDFDLAQVRVLQTDENTLHQRAREDLNAGGITLNEFRQMIGLEPLPGTDGDVLYIPGSLTPTDPTELLAVPEPVVPSTLPGGSQDDQLALPPGQDNQDQPKVLKLPVHRKAASLDWPKRMERIRKRLERRAVRVVSTALNQQQRAILTRVGAKSAKDTREIINPENVLPLDAERKLREQLESVYLSVLEAVHALTEDGLGVAFDLPDPVTVAYLAQAGQNIRGIHETTLEMVRAALHEGTTAGESVGQLAARIRDLPAFTNARALMVARTELGQASNLAAVWSFRSSGVVAGIEIMDGDQDEPCAARNGRRLALADAGSEPPLMHPNCTGAFLPITNAAEIGVAA